jgi:hypothetical protein
MSKIDDAIHDALTEEDAEFLAAFDEKPQFFSVAFNFLTGPMRIVNTVILVVIAPLLGVAIWAAIKFTHAEDVRVMFLWFAAAALCVVGLMLIRLWFGMCIQTNFVLREIKRLELQVARLAARDAV